MKILVTGGAGYIGSHVVHDLIDAGHAVTILDDLSSGREENIDPRAEFIRGSILDEVRLAQALTPAVEAVFHFAAFKAAGESMLRPGKYARNNVGGTITLLNAMAERGVRRFVFSSTAAVYGYPEYLPIDEEHPLRPINFYGFTKLEIERLLVWYDQLQGLRYAALRYFNAAGCDLAGRVRGREIDPANLLPVVLEVAAGERPELLVFGDDYDTADGTGVRDYIHVNDLSTAHLAALDYLVANDASLTCNLATGQGYSVLEVIARAQEITGRPIPYRVVERRPGDPAQLYATSKIAATELGWQARHSDLTTLINSMWRIYRPER